MAILKKTFSSRQNIIRLVAALVILLCFIGTRFVAQVYGDEGDFFYPLVFFYSTPLVFIVVLGAFAVFLWDILPIYLGGAFSKALIVVLALIPCTCSIIAFSIWYFLASSYVPLPAHFNSISHENHIYYLAWDNSTSLDLDSEHNRYLIYRCDNLGVICREISSFSASSYEGVSGNHVKRNEVYFVLEDEILSVQLGTERVEIETASS
jgi:hypothetical protein